MGPSPFMHRRLAFHGAVRWLAAVPREVVERDCGGGAPTRHVFAGETVLDLGSAGKGCYLLSQVVGASGKVIGVDMNHEMLRVARRQLTSCSAAMGFSNIVFRKARTQDMGLDLEAMDAYPD